jgi:microcin C transport system substrate-binding protein
MAFSTYCHSSHGISTFNQLMYGKNQKAFDNTLDHPIQGGNIRIGLNATFDSLNPFIVWGTPAQSVHYTVARLFEQSHNEPASAYAYVAKSVDVQNDCIIFTLHENMSFDDGSLITANDVVFSFNALITHGHPLYAMYYDDIKKVVSKGPNRVVFYKKNTRPNRELPLILGQIPVLSKRFFSDKDFSKPLKTPMPASGPYVISSYKMGRSLTLKRRRPWWGDKVMSQAKRHNLDTLEFSYYLDSQAQFEAFKAGYLDIRLEFSSKKWAKAYAFEAVKKGDIHRLEFTTQQPHRANGLYFNCRKKPWSHKGIRCVIASLFDFDWVNEKIFYGLNHRNNSMFPNSVLKAPKVLNASQKQWIEENGKKYACAFKKNSFNFKNKLQEKISYSPSFFLRDRIEKAQKYFQSLGYKLNKFFIFEKNNVPLRLEILIQEKSYDRIFRSFIHTLKRAGIDATIRLVDKGTYQERLEYYDFDMIFDGHYQSITPGNEQRDFWGSKAANRPGSRNISGIHDPLIDKTIEWLIDSKTFPELVERTQTLDYLLMKGHYAITGWHPRAHYLAVWDKYRIPPPGRYGRVDISYWALKEEVKKT